jgi:outer membrane protein TolC
VDQARALMPKILAGLPSNLKVDFLFEATKARYQQAVAAYVNQVLIAYGDVEDALTDLHAQNYLRLAQVQYRQGLADYLIVIDAERTLLANQLSLPQAVNLQMGAGIRLIKALGGGWNPAEDASPR